MVERAERWRPITTLEVEFEGDLQVIRSHSQQLELEFHDSKPRVELMSNEEITAMMEDLNWRRACFWYSGQDRHGRMKMGRKMDPSSRLGLAIVRFFFSHFGC